MNCRFLNIIPYLIKKFRNHNGFKTFELENLLILGSFNSFNPRKEVIYIYAWLLKRFNAYATIGLVEGGGGTGFLFCTVMSNFSFSTICSYWYIIIMIIIPHPHFEAVTYNDKTNYPTIPNTAMDSKGGIVYTLLINFMISLVYLPRHS